MSFTDRFISVTIMNVNPKDEELTGKEGDYTPCVLKFNPRRIESYNETIPIKDYDPGNKIWTSVTFESGENFLVRMPLAKFEILLNKTQ